MKAYLCFSKLLRYFTLPCILVSGVLRVALRIDMKIEAQLVRSWVISPPRRNTLASDKMCKERGVISAPEH